MADAPIPGPGGADPRDGFDDALRQSFAALPTSEATLRPAEVRVRGARRRWRVRAVETVAVVVPLALLGSVVVGGLNGSDAPPVGEVPGVTDTTVTLTLAIDSELLEQPAQLCLGCGPMFGNPREEFQSMVDWANAQGGLAGRRIIPTVADRGSQPGDRDAALCRQITGDLRPFAVAISSAFGGTVPMDCYRDASTVVLGGGREVDRAALTAAAPYRWLPSDPAYDEYVAALIDHLSATGFLSAADEVGIISSGGDVQDRTLERVVRPALAALGIDAPLVVTVDDSDPVRLRTEVTGALSSLRGVDRILVLDDAAVAAQAIGIAAEQGVTGWRWAIGTPQAPAALAKLTPQEALVGSAGIGVAPIVDIPQDNYPFPAPGAEQECVEIYAAAGLTLSRRQDAASALRICDQVRFLVAAAERAGTDALSAETLAAGAARLGGDFQSAISARTWFGPGRYAGTDGYRPLRYDDTVGTGEFVYDSLTVQPFPRD